MTADVDKPPPGGPEGPPGGGAPRGRRGRRVLWGLLILLVVAAMVPLAALLALRSDWVHGRILSAADRALRDSIQVGLSADRVTIRDLGRSIAVDGLVLGRSPDRPLVTVERVEATLDLRSLVGDEPTVHELRLSGVRVDLGADLPVFGQAEPAEPSTTRPRIERFSAVDVSVVSDPLDETFDVWLDRWALDDVAIEGWYVGERFAIERIAGSASVRSHRRASIDATFDAAASGEIDGPFTVPEFNVTAEGLALGGRGEGTLSAAIPFAAAFEATVDAGRLFPDLTPDGKLDARGTLTRDAKAWDGDVEVDADRFPGELLAPLLADTAFAELALAGTRLAGRADVDAGVIVGEGPVTITRVDGAVDLTWADAEERLLVAHADADAVAGTRLDVTLDLLPDAPGRRRIAGTIAARDWRWPAADATISARGEIEANELEQPRWYFGLDGALPWTPTGDLRATLAIDGPLATPAVDAALRWEAEGRTVVRADARTAVGTRPFVLRFDAGIFPGAPGERTVSGTWTADDVRDVAGAALDNVRVVLEVPDVPEMAETLTTLADGALPGELSARWREWSASAAPALRGSFEGTAAASGPLRGVRFDADAHWLPSPAESVRVEVHGSSAIDAPLGLDGIDVAIDVAGLSLAGFGLEAAPTIAALDVAARLDGEQLELTRFSTTLAERFAIPGADRAELDTDGPTTIEGRGTARLALPLAAAHLELTATDVADGVKSATAEIRLDDGILRVESSDVRYAGDSAGFAAEIPLGSLGAWSERLNAASIQTATGPFALRFDSLAVAPLLSLFGIASDFDATIDGALTAESGDVLAAEGELRVGELRADLDGERLTVDGETRIAIGNGVITLPPTDLVIRSSERRGTAPLTAAATLHLDTRWRAGQETADLFRNVAASVDGAVAAGLLNPFLPGLRATGQVLLDVDVDGPAAAPNVTARLTGPEARLLYAGKYPMTLEDPDIELWLRDGRPRLDHARGRLNGGRLDATGELLDEGGMLVQADVTGARMRLDLGVTAQVDADLALRWPETGMRRLSGRIVVERGVLRRDLNLEREALRILFEPSSGADLPALDLIALDLAVDTREGVFIDNNLADLHADWSGLRVTGTAGHPLLNGAIDVAPGGWLNAFGTVFRIDELQLSWADEAPSDVRIVIETTSSLDDPALLQQYRGLAFASVAQRGPGQGGQLDFRATQSGAPAESVTASLVNYYQDKLAGAASAGRTEFTFEPVPLFGETDTQARYTLWQHINPTTSLIWSVDPRQSEAQTWILDLHGFDFAPRWRMQLFTRDASVAQGEAANNAGATIQQTLEFGGGKPRDEHGRKLRKVVVNADGVSRRRVKAASGYRKGDSFVDGAVLDVEVDVIDLLRRRGHPTGDVDVHLRPLDAERAELEVSVVAGERVDFRFEGERLPKSVRREIRSLYRPLERDERWALEVMRAETERWLRAMGFLSPVVRVDVLPADPTAAKGRKTVRVAMQGGRQVEPELPVIHGVPEPDARAVAGQFGSLLNRVELAAGLQDADALLVQSMRAIGYPAARVTGRELSTDGTHLTVDVVPGPQQRIVAIGFAGVGPAEAEHLASFLRVDYGDPPRFAEISGSYHAMEDDLAARGHATARVRALVTAADPTHPLDVELRFEVAAGPVYRIADVRYDGLRGTKPHWVEKNAGLEPGALLRRDDIADARRQLYRTGVFRRIQVSGDRPGIQSDVPRETASACGPLCAAEVDDDAHDVRHTEVVFDMEEKRRYQLSYGLRWESDTGLGLVVDAVDRNSLGRGHTTGARAIYGSDLKSLRLYHQIPRIVRHRSSLEFFIEGREERVNSETTAESIQFWTQFTTPLGARTQTRLYSVFEDQELVSGSREDLDGRVVSPRLGWQWVYTTVDRALGRDRKGWFVGLDLSGGHEDLGSDVTTLAAFEQLKLFVPFRKKTFNWAQSWRVGIVDSRHEPVPIADRLRAGGSYSVRGYPTNSLGPVGPDGESIGGEVQLIVNQELHRVVAGPVAALAFFDIGNVWESVDSVDSDLFKSVGLGARYNSPVGPLRLDIAWPLDRRPTDPTYQIYFGFGQVF